jgi:hypothetical protein
MPTHRHSGPRDTFTSNVDPANYKKVPVTIDKQDIGAYAEQTGKLVKYGGELFYFRGFVGEPIKNDNGSVDGSRYSGHLQFEEIGEGVEVDPAEAVQMYKTKPPEAEEVKRRR